MKIVGKNRYVALEEEKTKSFQIFSKTNNKKTKEGPSNQSIFFKILHLCRTITSIKKYAILKPNPLIWKP